MGKRRAPNGVCHSWEHGCALGVARYAVCPSASESVSFFSFFSSFPFVSWWLVGLAKCDFRGTERTDRRRITRSTFSIQEVGSETAIWCGKTRVQEESTDENARLFPWPPGQKRYTSASSMTHKYSVANGYHRCVFPFVFYFRVFGDMRPCEAW